MSTMTNQRPGTCTACLAEVPPGAGSLWWEPGPDDGGDVVGRTPAGWRVTHLDRSVCEANYRADEARRLAAVAAAERRDAAEAAARAAQQAEIDRLLAEIPDCVCAGYEWDRSVLAEGEEPVSFLSLYVPENPAMAGLSLGRSDWRRRRAKTGELCYTHSFGNAYVLWAPRAVVEAAWAAEATRTKTTPAASIAWLREYGPSGTGLRPRPSCDTDDLAARGGAGQEFHCWNAQRDPAALAAAEQEVAALVRRVQAARIEVRPVPAHRFPRGHLLVAVDQEGDLGFEIRFCGPPNARVGVWAKGRLEVDLSPAQRATVTGVAAGEVLS